jgi:quercetin dioxygenase-like cupin family protein
MKQVNLRDFLDKRDPLPRTTTLIREHGLRTLLLHLKAGEEIPEHHTRGPILVHCLSGDVKFSSGDQVDLKPGTLISLEPGAPHSLSAREDSLLLVTISEDNPTTSSSK